MNFYESYTDDLPIVLQKEFQGSYESEILKNLDYRMNTFKLSEKKNYSTYNLLCEC